MKYAFITQHKKTWPVDLMCRLLGVSRNAYYRYCQRQGEKQPDPEHHEMQVAVREIAEASHDSYGSRRMKRALNALGYPVGRYKARSLMRDRCQGALPQEVQGDHQQQPQEAGVQKCLGAGIYGRKAGFGLCFRHHVYLDTGRLAVFGGVYRPV